MEARKRISGVDGIRAIACLMVIMHHANQHLSPGGQSLNAIKSFLRTGDAGVSAFFVLSGYLLASPFWRAWVTNANKPSLRLFALRRWARIAPAFWINLILCFTLSVFLIQDSSALNLVSRFTSGLTFTSGLSWQTLFPVELNAPLWSISFEVFSYVFLGLLAHLWFFFPGERTLKRGIVDPFVKTKKQGVFSGSYNLPLF